MNPSATESCRSGTRQALNIAERVRLMLDGIVNNLNPIVSGALGIVLVPIMLRGLGGETYGLWIIALSLPGIVGAIDFGLGLSVTLQVAGCRDSDARRQAARFVMAGENAHVGVGLVGAAIIGVLGIFSRNLRHLPHSEKRLIPAVTGLVGLSNVCERMGGLEGERLSGLRRFNIMNLISVAATVLEFGGIVGLIVAGTVSPQEKRTRLYIRLNGVHKYTVRAGEDGFARAAPVRIG